MTIPGPGVDAQGHPVIDPTANVIAKTQVVESRGGSTLVIAAASLVVAVVILVVGLYTTFHK